MKKLTVAAAALAAGLFSVVAHSQAESDRFLARHGLVAASNTEGQKDVKAAGRTRKKASSSEIGVKQASKVGVKRASKDKRNKKKGRTRIQLGNPGVDAQTTASISSARPVLKAKARKSIFGLFEKPADEVEVAVGSAGKTAKVARSTGYTTLVSRYAAAYGVPESLAHAVIRVESNYRENARGSAGEIGLMQIKPSTARMMGYSGGSKGLFNPETNIKFGMKYLGMAHQLSGGNTCGTILRYNAGHGARRMNPVSAAYCSKVKGLL